MSEKCIYSSKSALNSELFINKEGLGGQEELESGGNLLVTLDTVSGLKKIPVLKNAPIPMNAIEEFNDCIIDTLQDNAIPPIVAIQEKPFYQGLSNIFDKAIEDADSINARVVNLDRFIGSSKQSEGSYTNISIGRVVGVGGEISIDARVNEKPLTLQLEELKQQMLQSGQDSIIIVDDGLWDIPCLESYQSVFTSEGIKVSGYYVGVGLYGDEEKNTLSYVKESNQLIESSLPVKNLVGWFCGRDLMFCGGKLYKPSDSEPLYTVPYFAPFSENFDSIIPASKLVPFSRRILQANLRLIESLEKVIGRKLTFQDMLDSGYGILTSKTGEINPSKPDDCLEDYLRKSLVALNSNFSRFFTPQGFYQLEAGLRLKTESDLGILNTEVGNKLIILFGTSGVGKTTLAKELVKQNPGSLRLKRTTTRDLRTEEEASEITSITNNDFLSGLKNNQVVSAVNYPANSQLYGVTLAELSKLQSIPTGSYGVIEGTGDVLQLKRLLPNASLVVVLAPSLDELEARIIKRANSTNAQSRMTQSLLETSIISDNLKDMIEQNIVDLVVINQESEINVSNLLANLNQKNNL
jgi:guanylate kinase